MSKFKRILSMSLTLAIMISNFNINVHASPIPPPVVEEEYEYYQIRSGYSEIQTYPNAVSKTLGVPSNPASAQINSYVGQNKDPGLSTYDKRYDWGNHIALTARDLKLPTAMPDGAIVTGIEWVRPLVNGTKLGNNVEVADSFNQIKEVYDRYKSNGNKHLPFEWSLATDGKKAIVLERDSEGYVPPWEHISSLRSNIRYSTPESFKNKIVAKSANTYDIVSTEISAKPPEVSTENKLGLHWTKKEEVNKSLYNDAMEIRAHWKFGHDIDLGRELSYKELQTFRCEKGNRPFGDKGQYNNDYCKSAHIKVSDKYKYKEFTRADNPIRKNPGMTIDKDFKELSEEDKEYYKQMPGGTYQSSTFCYGTKTDKDRYAWRKAWSSSYIVGGDTDATDRAFAQMFNGTYDSHIEEYRTYTPYIVKFKVKIPPTNIKMPYNAVYGVSPNSAKFEGGYLHIRPVAVLDAYKSKNATVPAQINLSITNRTVSGTNEFVGQLPHQLLAFQKPLNYMDKILKAPDGIGMTPIVGLDTLKFKVEQTDKEQKLHIRMEVNPENIPEEPERNDNVWEAIVTIPANNIDLIAEKIEVDSTNPTNDWSQICTNLLLTTRARGTAKNAELLSKYQFAYTEADIWVDGVKKADVSYQRKHFLVTESVTNSVQLCLPNIPTKPGYNVKVRLTINETRDKPPGEKTYTNNVIEETFFIPTIKKPTPPPPKPIIPDPDLILPFYDEESYKCYLPKNPKTGQKEQILYSVGTMTHNHEAFAVKWTDASGNNIPPINSIKENNWGRPMGWDKTIVHGWHCPPPQGEDGDAPACCYQYVKDNQKATGFTWWDKIEFQSSDGASRVKKFQAPILQLAVATKTVKDHKLCYSNCCYGYGTGHFHTEEERTGTDYCSEEEDPDCDGHEYTYTVCIGQAPPHYHSHTEYSVEKLTSVQLEHNIKTGVPISKTVDHATGHRWTRAGYGIYSTLNYNYLTDMQTPNAGCCSWGAEAYIFMPHLNKELPHRIVPMEINSNVYPFPKAFQTAKNKKSLQNYRKQFVDVDYPDKDMIINFRYKLKAPSFVPTQFPTASEQNLRNKFPTANSALGACIDGSIRIEGNMWNDVWVHPDDPVTLQRP